MLMAELHGRILAGEMGMVMVQAMAGAENVWPIQLKPFFEKDEN